jgi:hypothetical protein
MRQAVFLYPGNVVVSAASGREDPCRAEREVDARDKWGMPVEVIFEGLEK